MKKKPFETILYSAVGLVAVFVLIAAFNIIASAVKQRADLTEERAFTLSAGTKTILDKLDTPVKIRFYSSQVENATPETVFLANYARQVADLLDEIRQRSNGKVIIEKYNPQPDSEAEDSARLDGVEGQALPPYGENYYLGLAASLLDQKAVIPFLSPTQERLLEYEIMRAITQVTTAEKPVVGVMSALPVFGAPMNPMMMRMGQQGQDPWFFINELKRVFDVREVALSVETIDDDIKVLVVIYPKDISEVTQYAIDQFVLRGGKLVAFLDPLSIADNRNPAMNPLQRATSGGASLDRLLKAWGLEFDIAKVVSDRTFKTRINRGGRPEETPSVLSLNNEAMNREDVLTSQLDNILLPYAGAFSGTPADGLRQTVLVHSSRNSEMVDKIMAEFGGAGKDFTPSDKEFPLAVRLSGRFKTAFPDGKPGAQKPEDPKPAEDGDEPKPATSNTGEPSLKESAADNVVVLIGDSDLIYDPVCVQIQNILGFRAVSIPNGNLNFAQSAVEQVGGDSNLIAVRSRASLNRPFTVVKQMEEKAQNAYRSKIKELEGSLQQTQQKLNELQQTKDKDQRFVLSPEQQEELTRFRKAEAATKKDLKTVQKNLTREIDSLENRLKWINIAAMPFVVALSGIVLALYRRNKSAAK